MLEKEIFEKLFLAIFRGDDFLGYLVSGIILNNKRRQRVGFGQRRVLQCEIASALHDSAAGNENIDGGIEIICL